MNESGHKYALYSRLRQERARLGLNQDVMAAAAGLKRNAQVKYEKGERSPDAEYLAAVAALGVDVAYVLTGEHAQSLPVGHVCIARLDGFGALDLPDALVIPEFIVRQRIGITPIDDVRWVVNPSPAMEPAIQQHALVLVDIARSGHGSVVDGVTYAYTLAGRPDVRRVLIRKDHWSVAGVGKGADSRDVYLSDLAGLQIMGTVIGAF